MPTPCSAARAIVRRITWGSPPWKPHAMLADVRWGIRDASSPSVQRPYDSPMSAFRSTRSAISAPFAGEGSYGVEGALQVGVVVCRHQRETNARGTRRYRRRANRDREHTAFLEPAAERQRGLGFPDEHRHDLRRRAAGVEAGLAQPRTEALPFPLESPPLLVRAADELECSGGRRDHRRRQGRRVDQAAAGVLQVMDPVLAAGDVGTVDAEGLAERAEVEVDPLGDAELMGVALAVRPEDAGGVCLVDQ